MTIADRIRSALGEPLLKSLRASPLQALESGDTAFFDFSGSPSQGTRFWITFDDETGLCRVQLMRRHGMPLSERSRETLIQGKRGVAWSELARVVQALSQHGAP